MALRRIFSSGKGFKGQIYRITGVRPRKIAIYKEAFRHSSVNEPDSANSFTSDNERLEFLGDAILDAAIAEILFLRFPYKQEGFLTEMRTRIVNREQLAYLSERLGLVQMMEMKTELFKNSAALKTIGTNTLEALIGAIYLDRGYKVARHFIANRLVGQYLDMEKLMNTTISYKAALLKWAQKHKRKVDWIHEKEITPEGDLHTLSLTLDGDIFVTDKNRSRKKAEELCCEKACRMLEISE